MSDVTVRPSEGSLADVIRDLHSYRRLSGKLFTIALFSIVGLFRWLNDGPYADMSIYLCMGLIIAGMRQADEELARLVTRLAALLADGEGRPGSGA
jgi:hypothetical protein